MRYLYLGAGMVSRGTRAAILQGGTCQGHRRGVWTFVGKSMYGTIWLSFNACMLMFSRAIE